MAPGENLPAKKKILNGKLQNNYLIFNLNFMQVLKAFFRGLILGIILGLLLAPKSGEETRSQLKEKFDEAREKVVKAAKEVAKEVKEVEKGTKKVREKK